MGWRGGDDHMFENRFGVMPACVRVGRNNYKYEVPWLEEKAPDTRLTTSAHPHTSQPSCRWQRLRHRLSRHFVPTSPPRTMYETFSTNSSLALTALST